MDYSKVLVTRLPDLVIKMIVEKKLIDNATNSNVRDTPMELLFDIYEEFIDRNGEFDNWECYMCRESVLNNFIKMKPHIEEYAANNKL